MPSKFVPRNPGKISVLSAHVRGEITLEHMRLGIVRLAFEDGGTVKLHLPGFVPLLRALQHFRQLQTWKVLVDFLRENFQTKIIIGRRASFTLRQRKISLS